MRLLPLVLLTSLFACDSGSLGGDDTGADDTGADDTAVDDTTEPCDVIDAVVTDIDATLTTADSEWLQQIVDSGHDPAMRPDADTLMQGYAAKGYTIFYVTARGADLPLTDSRDARQVTEDWLQEHGFPFTSDHVFLADGLGAFGGSARGYKAGVLTDAEAEGYLFHYGYGNADTDIDGYRDAGMANEDLFLVGDLAGGMGVTGIANDEAYTGHLDFLDQVPDAACPE